MGSAILEATLPVFGAIHELPEDEGTTREGRARAKSCIGGMNRGKIGSRGESAGPGVAIANRGGERENPPTPGELLLGEYDALYAKYQRRVYRQCFRMVRTREDAEDLTQEVFLLLYRKAHTFRGEANFSTWLHRLTINTVLMKLRSHRRWRESVVSIDAVPGQDHGQGESASFASSIPAPPASAVDKIGLENALDKLSGGYRDVFLLHDAEGYRHDEIARILGISEGTSKSQLHKARFRLRQLVDHGGIRRAGRAHLENGLEVNPVLAERKEGVRTVAVAHRSRPKRNHAKVAAIIRVAA